MKIKRYIAIGDVHGCHEELNELIEKLAPGGDDQIILLGDVVNSGPDSHRSLALARQVGAICLQGNHERRLLNYRQTGIEKGLKKTDRATIRQFTEEDWTHLEQMPLHHYVPEIDTVFVHAGFLPSQPWQNQPPRVVTRIQVVDEQGRARKRSKAPDAPHWSTLWKGPPFVVYGHTPRSQCRRLEWSIGIDTACVQGGQLTAFILPQNEVVQVAARRRYT